MPDKSNDDDERLTRQQAGEILGLTPSGVTTLIARGELPSTGPFWPGHGRLHRSDVEALAAARAKKRQEQAEAQAARAKVDRRPKPPDTEHDWMSISEAARAIGVTPGAVAQQCSRGAISHEWHDGRRWIRWDLLELRQRARAAQASRQP